MAKKKSKKNQKQVEVTSPPAPPAEEPIPAVPETTSLPSEAPAITIARKDQSEPPELASEARQDESLVQRPTSTPTVVATETKQATPAEHKESDSVLPKGETAKELVEGVEARLSEETATSQGEEPVIEPVQTPSTEPTTVPITANEPETQVELVKASVLQEQANEKAIEPEVQDEPLNLTDPEPQVCRL